MGESNRSKNLKLASWDGGDVWYLQVYDSDTVISLDNSGFIKFDPDIEVGDENVYNTTASRLWSKVLLLLENDIKTAYAEMRQNGLTLDNIMECIVEEQIDKIPATYYNKDMQTKYLDFGNTYLYALHGSDKQHIKLWLEERLLYIDTLWDYDASTTDYVSLRSSTVGSTIYMDIETFRTMYLKVKWRNDTTGASTQKLRVVKNGEPTRFSFDAKANDQEIRVYGGQYIKSLGDLSNLNPTTITLIKAPKINSLICHSDQLINTDVSSCVNLSRVDLSGCTSLGSGSTTATILNVSNCTELQYLNIQETALQGIELNPKGSNIKEIWFPKAVQSISLNNCPQLTTVGLSLGHSCKEIRLINCPKVEAFGDRKLIKSNNSYALHNGTFLSCVNDIEINNSCLDMKEFVVQYPIGLQSIKLVNLSNMTSIKLGVNIINEEPKAITLSTDYISLINNSTSIKIDIVSCKNLKDFYLTGRGKYANIHNLRCQSAYKDDYYLGSGDGWCNYPDYIRNYLGYSGGGDARNLSAFVCNKLDLSNTSIENFNVYISSYINGVKLPTTIKNIEMNKWKLCDEIDEFCKANKPDYSNKDGIFRRKYYDGPYSNTTVSTFYYYPYVLTTAYGTPYIEGLIEYISISNIYFKDDFEPSLEQPIWDFENINLESLHLANMRFFTGNNGYFSSLSYVDNSIPLPTLKNLNIKSKECTPDLYFFKSLENCTIDLTEFSGESLRYALANFNDNNTVILPDSYDNNIDGSYIIKNINTTKIEWTNPIVSFAFSSLSNLNDFSNITLKEQSEEDEYPSFYNDIVTRCDGFSYNPFKFCNIKYIDRIDCPNVTNASNMFNNQNSSYQVPVEIVNYINFPKCENFYAFINQNSIIRSIGTIHSEVEVTNMQLFANWSSNFTGVDNFDFTLNAALQISFSYNYKYTKPIKIKGTINSLYYSFVGTTTPKVDLTECDLSNCTSMSRTFSDFSGEILLPDEYIPDTCVSCDYTFYNCTSKNFKALKFRKSSSCINLNNMYARSNINFDESYYIPSGVTNITSMFGVTTLPDNFELDMSDVDKILNGNSVFESSKNIKNLKIKFPKYVYNKDIGTEHAASMQNMLKASNKLQSIEFDYSSYKGNLIGTAYMFGDTYLSDFIFKGIDFDKLLGGYNMSINQNSNQFITDFTVNAPANNYDINVRYWEMSYETYERFIDEVIDTLDCANILSPVLSTDKSYQYSIGQFPTKSIKLKDHDTNIKVDIYYTSEASISYRLMGSIDGESWDYITGANGKLTTDDDGNNQPLTLTVLKKYNYIGLYLQQGSITSDSEWNAHAEVINNLIKTDDVYIKYTEPTQTAKTLTLSGYTNYAKSSSLNTEQRESLTLKAVAKGWNLVFTN